MPKHTTNPPIRSDELSSLHAICAQAANPPTQRQHVRKTVVCARCSDGMTTKDKQRRQGQNNASAMSQWRTSDPTCVSARIRSAVSGPKSEPKRSSQKRTLNTLAFRLVTDSFMGQILHGNLACDKGQKPSET
uniref:Stc1 domain-containing protein n=1 Tax=Steinernema glaseri TaxID=37863 RepID=A0A1I7Z6B3_9BILA